MNLKMTHQIKEGYTCIYCFISKNVCKPFGSELKLLNSDKTFLVSGYRVKH